MIKLVDKGLKEKICGKYDRLKSYRSENWDRHWEEVIRYTIPKYEDQVYTLDLPGNRGQKRNTRVYEGTAIQANQLLGSALHGMLTSPASPFFSLTTGDPEADSIDPIRRWLSESTQKLHAIINGSNFQTEVHELYLALGSIGTGILLLDEDKNTVVRFKHRPIFEAVVEENNKGIVDVLYREYAMTVTQIEKEFGDLPPRIKEKIEAKERKEARVIHCIDREIGQANKLKGFEYPSFYILKDIVSDNEETVLLDKRGYNEFPGVVPRWTKTLGEVYGRSPAMNALPEIKMIQEIMKTTIRGAQKTVDPVLQLPDDGVIRPYDLRPSGKVFYRAGTQDRIEPLQTNAQVNLGIELVSYVAAKIRDCFMINELRLVDKNNMTATEAAQRTEENNRIMGPILGRLDFEMLRPLVDRLLRIAQNRGELPEAPDEMAGLGVAPRFISQIARAQRLYELTSLQRVLATVAPFVEASPDVMDVFDPDEIAFGASEVTGLPSRYLRPQREIEKMRKARAEQAQKDEAAQDQDRQVQNTSQLALADAQQKAAEGR